MAPPPVSSRSASPAPEASPGDLPLGRRQSRKRPEAAVSLPADWDEMYLLRDGRLITPEGVISLERVGKGLFSVAYREKLADGTLGRVYLVTHPDAHEKEAMAFVHHDIPNNPHVPAIERLGRLSDNRGVFRMPFYTTPYKAANASPESARAYSIIRKCVTAPVYRSDRPGYDTAYQKILCAQNAKLPAPFAEALEAMLSWTSNYGDSFDIEFSPRNVATDDKGNLVLLDLFFDIRLTQRIRQEQRDEQARKSPYRFNPLPPSRGPRSRPGTAARHAARPGERLMTALFIVEPLRGYVYDHFFQKVPVFGAEIEPEGDHFRLRPGQEESTLLRLADEGMLRDHDPRRLVVFGLYEHLTRAEASKQVARLTGPDHLAAHVYLIVGEMKHRLTIDRLKLKEAGLKTSATFDDILAAGLGPHAVIQDLSFDLQVVKASIDRLCEDIADHDDQTRAVLEVYSASSDADAREGAIQKAKEMRYDLKYAALAAGSLQAVRIKATRYARYRPHMCDPSWS